MKLKNKQEKKIKSLNYISAKEARAISKKNRRITDELEKKKNRKCTGTSESSRPVS